MSVIAAALAAGAATWLFASVDRVGPITDALHPLKLRLFPDAQHDSSVTMSAPEARRKLEHAVRRAGARPGVVRVRARGTMINYLLIAQLPQRARPLLGRSAAVIDLVVTRPGSDDSSTARGTLRIGRLVSVPIEAHTMEQGNRMTIDVNRERRYSGTAAGIALDVGREMLEHTWLWTTRGGTCSADRPQRCTIQVRVSRNSLLQQLESEPAGQVSTVLRTMRSLQVTAQLRGSTLIADHMVAIDTSGRRLRIESIYG